MKIAELIDALSLAGVSESKAEAYILVEHLFGVDHAHALLDKDREYDKGVLEEVIRKREKKQPLQYILGEWSFMGHLFKVKEGCLIPRPDTEILVYEAIRLLNEGACVLDLCTGSGCIGISLLKAREDIKNAVLVDISPVALEIARENISRLGVGERCLAVECDIARDFPNGRFDMIVSNPPYIPSADIDTLSDEVKNEPMLALDGGEDGLDLVRVIIDNAPKSLLPNGYLLIEHGYDQADKIREIMDRRVALGEYKHYKIVKDYGGNDRVLIAQI